jgi:rhamnopyranosyl-N-acetylglucosaminyl-diphospho-decaprenol beta-1,3/1,4-galactofuranosyltransferase
MSEPSPHLSTDGYSAAIVTFRREGELARVLDGLVAQAAAPGLVVVADNDPDRSAEDVVASFAADADVEVVYLPVGRNLGPAGGWAAAAALAASHPARGKWFAVFDDDDPIAHPDVMLRLIRRATAAPPEVAAVGLRGATLRRWSATLRRAPELPGSPARADYLASGGAPLYRWSAIEDVGFFDPDLFFGFEDLDLRSSDLVTIQVCPRVLLRVRCTGA